MRVYLGAGEMFPIILRQINSVHCTIYHISSESANFYPRYDEDILAYFLLRHGNEILTKKDNLQVYKVV